MAVTQNSYTGNGSTTNYSFTFPYLKQSEIKASLDATVTTAFTIPNATTIQFNTAPASGVKIKIYRETDSDSLAATFYAGSAIKSEDLNDNFTQNLYATQEVTARYLSNLGGTMIGDLQLGEDVVIKFEGATDNDYETTVTVVDPTADRTITLPNVTGTVVTTGDTGTVATAMIANDAINGTKLADNAINSEHYTDGSIDHVHLANDIIDGDNIQDDVINSEHIAAGALDTEHYAANSVDAAALAHTSVTAGTYTAADITVDAQGRLTAAASGTIAGSEIAADAIDGTKIADNAINSEHYVDGSIDREHLAADIIDGSKIADSVINSEHYVDGSIDVEHLADNSVDRASIVADAIDATKIADNAVTTDHIQDAELTTLAGMQSGTASILASSTALTSTTTELNQLDGKTLGETTLTTNSDTAIPTSKAVNDRILTVTNALGGFVAIANETSFPATHPDPSDGAGTVVSVSDAGGVVVNGSGVASITNGAGSGNTVTINGFPSSLYSKTLAAGIGLQVQTTTTLHTYDYHKILAKEADVEQLSGDINDFNERYRVASSAPGSNNDAGDLYFDTGANKMKVYNATTSAWDDVASVGNFYINTISSSSGTGGGSATFNGSAYRFTLSNAPTMAQQLIVSVNGVIQKPNAGTSQPSEGFAISGNDIIFSAAPASGSDYFIVTQGSSVSIGTPSDNTVSTAKIQNLAVNSSKLAKPIDLADNEEVRFGTGNDLQIYHDGTDSIIKAAGSATPIKIQGHSSNTSTVHISARADKETIKCLNNSNAPYVELYYDNSKKFETDTNGVTITGTTTCNGDVHFDGNTAGRDALWDRSDNCLLFQDDAYLKIGTGADLQIYHDGSSSTIYENGTGPLNIQTNNSNINIKGGGSAAHNMAIFKSTEGVELYYNDSKKFETTSAGVTVTGTVSDSKGDLRKIIQNTQGSAYTLVASDAGKHILASGNITIPNSVFSAGDGVVIVNNTSGDLTITSGITNLYLGTDGSTGNKTLASRCTCTVLFTSGTAGYISGGGLS